MLLLLLYKYTVFIATMMSYRDALYTRIYEIEMMHQVVVYTIFTTILLFLYYTVILIVVMPHLTDWREARIDQTDHEAGLSKYQNFRISPKEKEEITK